MTANISKRSSKVGGGKKRYFWVKTGVTIYKDYMWANAEYVLCVKLHKKIASNKWLDEELWNKVSPSDCNFRYNLRKRRKGALRLQENIPIQEYMSVHNKTWA